jgi:hypothetical protein
MFGKPEWFRAKQVGFGLVPVSWQGWLYSGAWSAAAVLPFWLLVMRHQPVEAAVWAALALAGLAYDVRQIRHVLRRSPAVPPPATAQPAADVVRLAAGLGLKSPPRRWFRAGH